MQQCLVKQPNWAAGCNAIGELLRVSSESLLHAANSKRSQARRSWRPVGATNGSTNGALNAKPIARKRVLLKEIYCDKLQSRATLTNPSCTFGSEELSIVLD